MICMDCMSAADYLASVLTESGTDDNDAEFAWTQSQALHSRCPGAAQCACQHRRIS